MFLDYKNYIIIFTIIFSPRTLFYYCVYYILFYCELLNIVVDLHAGNIFYSFRYRIWNFDHDAFSSGSFIQAEIQGDESAGSGCSRSSGRRCVNDRGVAVRSGRRRIGGRIRREGNVGHWASPLNDYSVPRSCPEAV